MKKKVKSEWKNKENNRSICPVSQTEEKESGKKKKKTSCALSGGAGRSRKKNQNGGSKSEAKQTGKNEWGGSLGKGGTGWGLDGSGTALLWGV